MSQAIKWTGRTKPDDVSARKSLSERQSLRTAEVIRRLYIPAVALLIFAYPLTTVIQVSLGLETRFGNVMMNATIALLFLVSLAGSLRLRRTIPVDFFPLYLFYFLYGIRLVYDVFVRGIILDGTTAIDTMIYFFVLTFMPIFSIGLAFEKDDVPSLHRWMLVISALANLALLLHISTNGEIQSDEIFNGRYNIRSSDEMGSVLNPITISMAGTMLCLFVMGSLTVYRSLSAAKQIGLLALFTVGMFNMLVGGSRGPVLAFLLGILFMGIAIVMSMLGKGLLRIGPRVAIYLVVVTFVLFYVASQGVFDIYLFDRFEDMFYGGGGGRLAEERDLIYAAAWESFVDSPLFGSGYTVMDGLTYPHNIFLESLTSVGLFGGLAYAFSFWVFVRGVFSGLFGYSGPHGFSIALIAVAMMTIAMTSGSVGKSPSTWATMSIMMCMSSIGIGRRTPGAAVRR